MTANTDTVLLSWFVTASSPPPGLNATETGTDPVANGEPATAVSAPVVWLTANTDTVSAEAFAVASSPPPGLNTADCGPDPVANGEPATAVNAPAVWLTENTDTSLPWTFATASSPPPGLNATDLGFGPVANGEPDTCPNACTDDANAQHPINTSANTNPVLRISGVVLRCAAFLGRFVAALTRLTSC